MAAKNNELHPPVGAFDSLEQCKLMFYRKIGILLGNIFVTASHCLNSISFFFMLWVVYQNDNRHNEQCGQDENWTRRLDPIHWEKFFFCLLQRCTYLHTTITDNFNPLKERCTLVSPYLMFYNTGVNHYKNLIENVISFNPILPELALKPTL